MGTCMGNDVYFNIEPFMIMHRKLLRGIHTFLNINVKLSDKNYFYANRKNLRNAKIAAVVLWKLLLSSQKYADGFIVLSTRSFEQSQNWQPDRISNIKYFFVFDSNCRVIIWVILQTMEINEFSVLIKHYYLRGKTAKEAKEKLDKYPWPY